MLPARDLDRVSAKALDFENLSEDIGRHADVQTAIRIRDMLDKVCLCSEDRGYSMF